MASFPDGNPEPVAFIKFKTDVAARWSAMITAVRFDAPGAFGLGMTINDPGNSALAITSG